MVVAAGGAHEDRLATELGGHDLETEDPPVELGCDRRVPDEQDRVVEAGDGDVGPARGRRGSVGHLGHAAAGTFAGAPTSFQPDCHDPPLAMFTVMFRKARPSSWRARASGPTSIGLSPIEATRSRT
jgi:hypothetical protein